MTMKFVLSLCPATPPSGVVASLPTGVTRIEHCYNIVPSQSTNIVYVNGVPMDTDIPRVFVLDPESLPVK